MGLHGIWKEYPLLVLQALLQDLIIPVLLIYNLMVFSGFPLGINNGLIIEWMIHHANNGTSNPGTINVYYPITLASVLCSSICSNTGTSAFTSTSNAAQWYAAANFHDTVTKSYITVQSRGGRHILILGY